MGYRCEWEVVGVGAVTPLGDTIAASAAAVRAGIAAFEEHPFMIDRAGEPMVTARISRLEDAPLVERMIDMGVCAAREALASGGAFGDGFAMPMFLGLPEGRPGWRDSDAESVLEGIYLQLSGETAANERSMVPRGHASGLIALDVALSWIANGRAEACLVGGVDSYENPDTLEHLDERDQLHSAANPVGFVPGEGAGFCVVTSTSLARRFGLGTPAG